MTPSFFFYLAAAIVLVIAGMIFLLRTPQAPIVKVDDEAIKRAQLDVASRLGRSQSVIVPKQGNGRR